MADGVGTADTSPRLSFEHGVNLASLTSLRVGGPAHSVVEVERSADLVSLVADCDRRGEPLLILGGGSNVVICDQGFDGTVALVRTRGVLTRDEGDQATVRAEAGEPWDLLVAYLVAEGLSGVEALSGIPGRTGATPIQNVGAYGQELASVADGVEVFDRHLGEVCWLTADECGFGYRSSRFKLEPERFVILAVQLILERSGLGAAISYAELAQALDANTGDRPPARLVRRAVLGLRRSKGMVLDIADHDTWSTGSFFTNPVLAASAAASLPADAPQWPLPDGRVKVSAAWLIEHAGIRRGTGVRPGAAALVSARHTLALTNRGTASAADVLELARHVRERVREAWNIELEPEPVLVGCQL